MKQDEENKSELSRREAMKMGAVGLIAMMPAAALAKSHEAHHEPEAAPVTNLPPNKLPPRKTHYTWLKPSEVAFFEAAIDRLIPADETWPGGVDADVTNYFDKQLGGTWGAGERLYRGGPWKEGVPQQGYQLPYTPAEFFRRAIAAINESLKPTPFAKMSHADQEAYLHSLESGKAGDLNGIPSKTFFAQLWAMVQEGFFADPEYGGNREMISWKMIGFPGAYASYYDLVDKHGIRVTRAPMSIAQDSMGQMHMNPNVPARVPMYPHKKGE